MPVVMYARVPNVTADQYHAVIEAIQESLGGETPDGALFHVAHVVDNDVQVTEVWESEAANQAFVEAYVMPAMQKAGVDAQPDIYFHEAISEVDL